MIEQLHLSATTSKKLIKALSKSDEVMKSFQRNPKIVFADSAEFNEELKSGTSTSFNFNFSSSKIKMTNKDGKTVEIDDQHPDWQEIKKQFNIDLTQPEALSKFAESFIQGQTHNTATQETFQLKMSAPVIIHPAQQKLKASSIKINPAQSGCCWDLSC